MAAGKHGIEKKREKPSALRIVLIVLIVALSGVFLVSGFMLAREWIRDETEKSAFNELTEIKKRAAEKAANAVRPGGAADPGAADPGESDTASSEKDPGGDPDEDPGGDPAGSDVTALYEELAAMNGDLFGWVTIDGTVLDYPVMFTPKNPEYYLRRGFDKKYSYSGVPFMDGKCVPDGNHYLIYGHNMKNQTMFSILPKYQKKSYFEEHPIIKFDTLNESREYQVMAAFRSRAYGADETGVFRYYAYADLTKESRFEEYVKNCLRASAYKTGVTAEFGDELLTLSTCDYQTEHGRFVVVAKRIK